MGSFFYRIYSKDEFFSSKIWGLFFVGKAIPQNWLLGPSLKHSALNTREHFMLAAQCIAAHLRYFLHYWVIDNAYCDSQVLLNYWVLNKEYCGSQVSRGRAKFHRVLYSCRGKDNPRWTKRKVIALLKINVSSSKCDNCSISVFSPFWKSLLEYSPGWLMRLFFTCSNL